MAFTAPAANGGSPITLYTATSNPDGISATGVASPITVPGLTNGTSYTFTVTATNSTGTSLPSSASNIITPEPPIIINNGSPYTKKTALSLALTYLGATSMQFTTNGTTWSAWGAYAAKRSLRLPPGNGLKTVSVRFRDSKLVISDIYSATITLDTKAPVKVTFAIDSAFQLSWGFSDSTSGIANYVLVRGTATYPACSTASSALIYNGPLTYFDDNSNTKSGTTYRYRLCAVDNAGNISKGATASRKKP